MESTNRPPPPVAAAVVAAPAGPTTKPSLKDIGHEGLVIFEPDPNTGKAHYYYVKQGDWQNETPMTTTDFDNGVIVKLDVKNDALLVNLDMIQPPPPKG